MKRFLILLSILLALASTPAFAALNISLDSVGNIVGTPADSIIKAGDTVKFYIRYTNTGDTAWNVTNAFQLVSPDGATWTDSAAGNFRGTNLGPIGIDTTGLLSKSLFPTGFFLRTFNTNASTLRADGASPDIISFSGIGSDIGQGLNPQTDVRHIVIRIRPKIADIGKHICVDSSSIFPPTNVWKWAALWQVSGEPTNNAQVFPSWSGRACFRVDTTVATGVDITPGDGLPTEFSLRQNYPNPFNPATNIDFELPERANVSLKVYNLLGQEVATLAKGEMAAGRYTATWDGGAIASGIYFYKLEAGTFVQTKKMVLMK